MPMTGVQKMCKLPNLATDVHSTMATIISSLVAVLVKLLQSPEDRNSNRPPVSKTTRCPAAQNSSVLEPFLDANPKKQTLLEKVGVLPGGALFMSALALGCLQKSGDMVGTMGSAQARRGRYIG
jgi:hypothetical protein